MRLFVTLILAGMLYAVVAVRLVPPAAVSASASSDVFSADRAYALLERLLDDESPHPMGSPGSMAVRGRLIEQLDELGYEAQIQTAPAFENRLGRLRVHNVVATLPGTGAGGVVLLNAHYDSIRGGPGASDDGVGVAALLEVARIVKAGPPLKNTLVFLFDDGEEMGLCGAKAFCREHELRDKVDVVLNFEARGTSGPSVMFETSGESSWLIDVMASAVSRPVTGSACTMVYEMLPNDTNLTVYKAAGIPGLNFAFIGDPQNYHTEQDDLAHVTLGSLQHHGDYALALARAFGDLDLQAAPREGHAVFFDVLSAFIVRWPQDISLWIAVVLFLATGLITSKAGRRDGISYALIAWLGSLLLPPALCYAGAYLMTLSGLLEDNLVGNSFAYSMTYWALSLAGFWLATRVGRSRTNVWVLWVVSWNAYAALALVTAMFAPAACYVVVVPLAVAVVSVIPAAMSRRAPGAWATVLPVLAAGLVWFPLQQMLPVALGVKLGWLYGAVHGVFLTTALAATARVRKSGM